MRRCCRTLGEPGLDPAWSCALLCYLLLVSKHAVFHTSPHSHAGVPHQFQHPYLHAGVHHRHRHRQGCKATYTFKPTAPTASKIKVWMLVGKHNLHAYMMICGLSRLAQTFFFRMCTKQDSVKLPGLHQSSCAMSGNKYLSPICAQPGLLLRTPSMRVSGCLGD